MANQETNEKGKKGYSERGVAWVRLTGVADVAETGQIPGRNNYIEYFSKFMWFAERCGSKMSVQYDTTYTTLRESR